MLRSDRWVCGDDEVALEHRVALRSAGVAVDHNGGRPIIGIANSASELNPCNLPLRALASSVREGILAAGGLPVEFPVVSLGEDLMKPTAMLYRNLLAIEVEEMLRAYPLDGVVLLANCDKTVPGALMGAASTGLPALVVTGGARPACHFRGKRIGTGTALWRLWDERRTGALDDAAWRELESCLAEGTGACNTMGTASTMAILAEVLGFIIPGTSTIPSGDPRAHEGARQAGMRVTQCVLQGESPFATCGPASFRNALRLLNAIGGSTNAVLHLAALAGRLAVDFDLHDVDRLGRRIPVIADVEPTGSQLIEDLDAAGGVPVLLRTLGDLLEPEALLADGQATGDVAAAAPEAVGTAIRSRANPLLSGGAFRIVRGSLAPDGALLKRSSASPSLLRHRGRAVVFRGYEDMRARVEDPDLDVDASRVLVLAGCGPVGGPGMPEWGMIPIPRKLLDAGVRDMVRVTDARMSGTSYGTVYLHAAPEAAVGGPLALVRDGDVIDVDADAGRLDLLIEPEELARRAASWRPPTPSSRRGWIALYSTHVTQAPRGCDFEFLEPVPGESRLVEPVVGRS